MWVSVKDGCPGDDRVVLVRGLSGYYAPCDVYVMTARYVDGAWLDMAGDRVTEQWQAPLEWTRFSSELTLGVAC